MAVAETQVVTTTTTTEEETPKSTYFSANPSNYSFEGRNIGSSVGFALGVAYGFKVKSGFWKGWGYAIIGSIVLGGVGYGVGMARKKTKA
tara:strand:+ start:435 stop:704 length:270 start_codon:yes stop_codon:yes gene_type:complete